MEKIFDTRTHFFKNCANPNCPNSIGPITGRGSGTELCADCEPYVFCEGCGSEWQEALGHCPNCGP